MHGLFLGVAALVCPVGMGLMMWFMGKGMRPSKRDEPHDAQSLAQLRKEHQRLGEQLEQAETNERVA